VAGALLTGAEAGAEVGRGAAVRIGVAPVEQPAADAMTADNATHTPQRLITSQVYQRSAE